MKAYSCNMAKGYQQLGKQLLTTRLNTTGLQPFRNHVNQTQFRYNHTNTNTQSNTQTHTHIPRCPPPTYDTGCTYCTPPNVSSLFPGDTRKDLKNTAPYYAKLLLLDSGTPAHDWPSKVELLPGSFANEFLVNRRKVLKSDVPVSFLHTDGEPSKQVEMVEREKEAGRKGQDVSLTLFPDGLYFKCVNQKDAKAFMETYLLSNNDAKQDGHDNTIIAHSKNTENESHGSSSSSSSSHVSFEPVPVQHSRILVCGHTQRDARCGAIGPLLAAEFRKVLGDKNLLFDSSNPSTSSTNNKALEDEKWQVSLCSHVGGHVYAGNVIILKRGTTGVWYGNVFPENVQGIVNETVVKGNIIDELHRGGKFYWVLSSFVKWLAGVDAWWCFCICINRQIDECIPITN